MSWIFKRRGDRTAPLRAEYLCPIHGRFELTVDRVNGDAPSEATCPASLDGLVLVCRITSPWVISAPAGHVKAGEIVRGKVMDYPPESVCLDTRPLAEGMPYSEWKAKQDTITRDINLKRSRANR